MLDKKELSDEQLEQVTGGDTLYDYYKPGFPTLIDNDELENELDKNILVKSRPNVGNIWYVGTLKRVFMESYACCHYKGFDLAVIDSNLTAGRGDYVTLYTDSNDIYSQRGMK